MTGKTKIDERTKKLNLIGRVLGLIDDVIPDGIAPSVFNQLTCRPCYGFNKLVKKANRYMPAYHKARFLEWMGEITEDDLNTPLQTGEIMILFGGINSAKRDLFAKKEAKYHKAKIVNPFVVWSDVDWNQSNTKISRLKGVELPEVQHQRMMRGL